MNEKQVYTEEQMMGVVRMRVAIAGTQKKFADKMGISTAYVSDIMHGRRRVSASLAKKLGYKLVTHYVEE